MRIEGSEARFEIRHADAWQLLAVAEHRGACLGWREKAATRLPDGHRRHWEACSTLAVALAVGGWPLIRSDATWTGRHYWSDLGEPDGLAYQIEVFEAIDRKHGLSA